MIDTEELIVELFEKGITTEILQKEDTYTIELKNLKDNVTIGVAKDISPEKALSTIIRLLADDSRRLKSGSNVVPLKNSNGLSVL